MAEYIEREAFIAYIRKEAEGLHTKLPMDLAIEAVANEAKEFPAADVVPMRHGRNISNSGFLCSECHFGDFGGFHGYNPNYCPNCGAKLDLEGQT